MPPEVLAHLEDIQKAARELVEYTDGISLEQYLSQGLRRRAAERCLEIIGEALIRIRRYDADLLHLIPGAAQAIGMRNIIAHEYGDVDDTLVWQVVTSHISDLLTAVGKLVPRNS